MASDIPAFLEEGTPVSAKFKGAFCEATIKSVKKLVKCKVLFKDGSGTSIINNEFIEGDLKLNSLVQVKQDDKEPRDASIQKMNDHSLYTVVFDDGDERTLRRTNVCVMGERHFQEHENLDNLPLTDPENFLTPVVLSADKRRKRRRSQPNLEEEDSDSDGPKSNKRCTEVDKEFLGKVICIEQGERKKSWFPALGLKRFGTQPDNQVYVQSFKDGKKVLVKKEDVKEFSKDKEPLSNFLKGDSKIDPILRTAIEKALAYHNLGELPKGWNILDTIDEKEESSDEDTPAPLIPVLSSDAKAFQENIYSFMKREGQPITKPPTINNQGVDLHKLYELVLEIGGMEEVTNQQWRSIYTQLGLRNIHTTASYNMKTLYKKYLYPYEEHLRSSAKSSPSRQNIKLKNKRAVVKDDVEMSSTKSESDSEPDRRRSTRSSKAALDKQIESAEKRKRSNLAQMDHSDDLTSVDKSVPSKDGTEHELDVKLSEAEDIDVVNSPQSSDSSEDTENRSHDGEPAHLGQYKVGSRIAVRYGSGKNQRVYNAKVLEVDKEEKSDTVLYYIHYNGWNHRHDEWIRDERIQGLSGGNTPKGKKHSVPPTALVKIAKDPPQKYRSKHDLDVQIPVKRCLNATAGNATAGNATTGNATTGNATTGNTKTGNTNETTITSSSSSSSKSTKSPAPQIEKPPSPLKVPILPEHPLFLSEPIKPIITHSKKAHHPKPVNDALFIPDIKPSPIKPRMTRNSMQDTFLLNALEESIGKPNQAAMTLQQDVLMKSEQANRRRSVRQQNPSFKSDNTESDHSSKDEKESDDANKKDETKQNDLKNDPMKSSFSSVSKKPFHIDPKESSKEDTVKKWIEDSSKVMSKNPSSKSTDTSTKVLHHCEPKDEFASQEESKPSSVKRGRRAKDRKQEESNDKKKGEESDDSEGDDMNDEDNEPNFVNDSNNSDNNNLQTEKDRTETAHALRDLCNIVENVPKLSPVVVQGNLHVNEDTKDFDAPSPTKDVDHKTKRKREKKRRRTQSMNADDEVLKSPKDKKEKRMSPPLEYKVDFMSDLNETLAKKDPVERIVIMQSRLNQMRKLYCKLRTEVASIDRRKRRKLRKQLDNRQKGLS